MSPARSTTATDRHLRSIKKETLICILLWFAVGCERGKQSVETIHIAECDAAAQLKLSDVVDSIKYTVLESTPGSLLGGIDKLLYARGNLYVLDRRVTKAIFVFNKDGKFLLRIQRRGRGPGEYLEPDDILVDPSNGRIVILDRNQAKLINFDHEGVYERETSLPFHPHSFARLTETRYAFYMDYVTFQSDGQNRAYNLVLTSDEGRILTTLFPFKAAENPLRIAPQTVFSVDSFGVVFFPPFLTTIFTIEPAGGQPRLSIDFGAKQLPGNYLMANKRMEELLANLDQYAHTIHSYHETSQTAFFSFPYEGRTMSAFYSKASQRVCIGGSVINDIDMTPAGSPIAVVENEFVGVVEPNDLRGLLKYRNHGVHPKTISLAESVGELSNPILASYRPKRF